MSRRRSRFMPTGDSLSLAALTPDAQPLRVILPPTAPCPISASVIVGPEGDLTPDEIVDARVAGFVPLSLGHTILRTETAAICGLSILRFELASRLGFA
jgi:16S rRNA (uracil1498-N3)-methyltransferase